MGKMLSSKLVRMDKPDGHHQPMIGHWCPACKEVHGFAYEIPQKNGAVWHWDANDLTPTFSPSMNIRIGPFSDGRIEVCHYFLKNGVIEYLSDCTHGFANTTTPLEDIPANLVSRYAMNEKMYGHRNTQKDED